MTAFIQTRVKSFANALSGILYFFKTQVHARIHLMATIIVIVLGFYFGVTRLEWCILMICISGVIALEAVNTAFEKLADKVSGSYDIDLGRIKDIAAGAVLVVSVAAAIIGLLVFIPYLAP